MNLKMISAALLGVVLVAVSGCKTADSSPGAGADPMRPVGSGGRGTGPTTEMNH